jgi:heat shock protein HslJ
MQFLRHLLLATMPLAIAACAVSDPGPISLPGTINAPPPPMDVAGDALLTNTRWKWQGTLLPNGSSIVPDAPESYAIEFLPGGMLNLRADCNRGRGRYLLNGAQLSFGAIGVTRMMCPDGSRDTEFLRQLGSVSARSYQGNDLVLTLSGNGGTMRFSTMRQ